LRRFGRTLKRRGDALSNAFGALSLSIQKLMRYLYQITMAHNHFFSLKRKDNAQ
jgi:hypothetical protein